MLRGQTPPCNQVRPSSCCPESRRDRFALRVRRSQRRPDAGEVATRSFGRICQTSRKHHAIRKRCYPAQQRCGHLHGHVATRLQRCFISLFRCAYPKQSRYVATTEPDRRIQHRIPATNVSGFRPQQRSVATNLDRLSIGPVGKSLAGRRTSECRDVPPRGARVRRQLDGQRRSRDTPIERDVLERKPFDDGVPIRNQTDILRRVAAVRLYHLVAPGVVNCATQPSSARTSIDR